MGKYEFSSKIRYSECGEDCRLHLAGVVNYFQDTASFQGEALGIGVSWLRENSLAWVLASWQIVTDHLPRLGETVTVRTWPYSFKDFFGFRNLEMVDENGERAAWANSVWVMMDTAAGRVTKVPHKIVELYGQEEKLEMEYAPRRIDVPEGGEIMEPFTIHRGHIDSNHHVNNGQYIQIAKDFLPDDFRVYETRVEYRRQTFLGDVIRPQVLREDHAVTVSLLKEDSEACAVIRFAERADKA